MPLLEAVRISRAAAGRSLSILAALWNIYEYRGALIFDHSRAIAVHAGISSSDPMAFGQTPVFPGSCSRIADAAPYVASGQSTARRV